MRAVQWSDELDRIRRLPVRQGTTDDLIPELSAFLRKDHVCHPKCAGGVHTLNDLQCQALIEAHDVGGLFLVGPIGAGKTIVSLLILTITEAKRPVLIVPGGIVKKTLKDIRTLQEHWRIVPLRIISYEFLSNEANADFLQKFKPDCVVFDESQSVKDHKGPRAKRIGRFVNENPKVPFYMMSGTPAKRSIKDVAHMFRWVAKENSPLPLNYSDLEHWACALDAGVQDQYRMAPGALSCFGSNIDEIRRGLGQRIFSTPGFITSSDIRVAAKLEVHLVDLPLSKAEDDCYQKLREGWETPDGHGFFDAIEMWRHARELAVGFYQVWNPRPPQWWSDPRKEWYAACREMLSGSHTLDTEAQVVTRLETHPNKHPAEARALAAWRAVKDLFTPNPEPRWVGDTALLYAAKWLEDGGVVWTEHVAFGQRLSALTGVPYFGEQGESRGAMGRKSILTYRGKSMIASWKANGTGTNLQHYDRCLLTSIEPTAYRFDQTVGRHHRQGQKSDVVSVYVPISCREQFTGFERMRTDDSAFHKDFFGIPSRGYGISPKGMIRSQSGWAWAQQKPNASSTNRKAS